MNQVQLYNKGENVQLSKNLNQSEMDCHCGSDVCQFTIIDDSFVRFFQSLRDNWGSGIRINSGFRCQKHNENVGGVSSSFHTKGMAGDLFPLNGEFEDFDFACRYHFKYVKKYQSFCHCDTRGL